VAALGEDRQVSAPYSVMIDHYGDHEHFDCATLDIAIKVAMLANRNHPGRVYVHGDGAEGEYFPDGSRKWHDGLTPDEREMVDEALDR
jgi:hypothetical protein